MREPKKRTGARSALGAWSLAVMLVAASASAAVAHDPPDTGGTGEPLPPTSQELEVLGNYNPLGGVEGLTTDVWAHGNYAYLGSFQNPFCSRDLTGVRIVDIADPTDPTQVAFIPAPPSTRNNDVKVAHIETASFTGDILVVTNEPCTTGFNPKLNSRGFAFTPGAGGISIYDVTDPENPRSLHPNFMRNGIHNTYIWQDGERAYLIAVDDVAARDVVVVDITNPMAPKEITRVGAPDWPEDIAEEFGDRAQVFLHDVWVQENDGRFIAYLSYWDAGLVLLDVTNPANPVFLGDSTYQDPDPLSGYAPAGTGHVAVPNADGTRVLFGDEDFSPSQLAESTFEGDDIVAIEGTFTKPVFTFGSDPTEGTFTGQVIWTGGEGCTASAIPPAPDDGGTYVALIQRGSCFFSDKAQAAVAQGYDGFIIANSAAGGEGLVSMAPATPDTTVDIPGVFVRYSTGESMKGAVGEVSGELFLHGIFDGWGYLRLLDVEDPENVIELDQYATENVFNVALPPGDRTMHNVVVDGDLAFISWYAEGMRVIDFSGDTLTEVAHYVDPEGSNFWGVYLHTLPSGQTVLLGSDRDSGLVIFDPSPLLGN